MVTNHSFDVLTHKGAYFGDVGVLLDRRVLQRIEVGGSTGFASSRFNDAYVGVHKSAFNVITVKSWLTAYVKPHFYVRPYFQFSTIVDLRCARSWHGGRGFLSGLPRESNSQALVG